MHEQIDANQKKQNIYSDDKNDIFIIEVPDDSIFQITIEFAARKIVIPLYPKEFRKFMEFVDLSNLNSQYS